MAVIRSFKTNILILNHRGLGDVLMSYPAIRWLTHEYSGNINMTVSSSFIKKVCEREIDIHNYYLISADPAFNGLQRLGFRSLFKGRKAFLDLIRTLLNIRLLKIDTVIGFSGYRIKDVKNFSRIINAKKWICIEENQDDILNRNTIHKVTRNIKIISKYLRKKIDPTQRNNYLFRRGINNKNDSLFPNNKFIIFTPGSSEFERFKRWPASEYISFGKSIVKNYNLEIIIVGADYEIDLCNKIADGINSDRVKNLCGKLTVAELKQIFACSQFVLGADAGGVHFAKACGANVVVLYGPGNSSLNAPINAELIIDLKIPGTPWYNRKNYKKMVHERNKYEPSMQIPSSLVIEKLKERSFL